MKIINLLPPAEQKIIKLERINSYFKRFLLLAIIIFILMISGFIAWRFYLQSTLSNIDTDIVKAEALISSQDNQKTKAEVERNNDIITDYNTFAAANPNWSPVLEAFAALVPKEVLVTNFSANTKTGKIDISGTGLNRDAVLQLRSNILATSQFRNINLPLENLQKPKNTPFNYTFFLAPNVLTPAKGAANAN